MKLLLESGYNDTVGIKEPKILCEAPISSFHIEREREASFTGPHVDGTKNCIPSR